MERNRDLKGVNENMNGIICFAFPHASETEFSRTLIFQRDFKQISTAAGWNVSLKLLWPWTCVWNVNFRALK